MDKIYKNKKYFDHINYTNLILILTEECRKNIGNSKENITKIKNNIMEFIKYATYIKKGGIRLLSLPYDRTRIKYYEECIKYIHHINIVAKEHNLDNIFTGNLLEYLHVEDFCIEVRNYYGPLLLNTK